MVAVRAVQRPMAPKISYTQAGITTGWPRAAETGCTAPIRAPITAIHRVLLCHFGLMSTIASSAIVSSVNPNFVASLRPAYLYTHPGNFPWMNFSKAQTFRDTVPFPSFHHLVSNNPFFVSLGGKNHLDRLIQNLSIPVPKLILYNPTIMMNTIHFGL